MANVLDLSCHDQTPCHREGAPLEIVEHHVLVVQGKDPFLVFWMHVLADAPPALGEEVVAGRRHVELLVLVGGGDLHVGAGRDIDVVEGVVLLGEAGGDLVVDLPLPRDLLVLLHLPVAGVNVVEAYDQARAFLLVDHGSLHLDIGGLAIYQETILQREDALVLDAREDVLFREGVEEELVVLWVVEDEGFRPDLREEVLACLCLGKALGKAGGCAELAIGVRCGVDHIDDDEIASEGVKAGVNETLFLYPHLRLALTHQLVDVTDGNNDEALVVLHAGDGHLDVEGPVVLDPAIGDLVRRPAGKHLFEIVAVHGPDEEVLVLLMYEELRVTLAALEEVRTPPGLGEHAESVIGVVFDELVGIHVDVVEVGVSPCQGMGNIGENLAGVPSCIVVAYCRVIRTPTTNLTRRILTHMRLSLYLDTEKNAALDRS